mmetsp:Transcript_58161/g.101832  ORF Transcript_58161/g.101832 Transcript_58161/m.101832 type:complete len:224 (-) Transcript_58161:71-742(-)
MVLLPGPAIPALSGPPSSFALSMRPWLLAVFVLFLPVAAARFLVLDVIGGFFLILTAGIGWYAVKGGMDITWLLCLAVILFLNSIFDAFILVARVVRTDYPLFDLQKLPWHVNLVHGVLFVGPLVELVGAVICWRIYREHLSNILTDDGMLDAEHNGGYGAAPFGGIAHGFGGAPVAAGGGAGGRPAPALPSLSSRRQESEARPSSRQAGFEAFKGVGRRLGE